MFYIPIIGALLESIGLLIEKKTMKKKNIDYKTYTAYSFLTIVILLIPLVLFQWKFNIKALELINILIFFLIVIIALIANVLIFYSLKRETLTEFEPINLMQPLFTILFAFLFSFIIPVYKNENNPIILILALIASIALIASHIDKKYHFKFNKYLLSAFIGSVLFALELVLSKLILPYYYSWIFYFFRCLFILIIAYILFRPNFKKIDKKTNIHTWIVGAIFISLRLILYWGYENLGIIITTITLSLLTPVFIFIFARLFLKEKIKIKHIISSIIIIACVITAIIVQK